MKNKTYCFITGIIFGLVSLLHLLRLVFWWPVQIGSWNVSFRISAIAFIISLILGIWGFRLAKQ